MTDDQGSTHLRNTTVDGSTFLEGQPGQPYLRRADDVTLLIEECFSSRTRRALLYAGNLPREFFDVSSQQAGTILQKLRSYRVRLAVVAPRDSIPMSSRFHELMAAEQRDDAFGVFDDREAAIAWLIR
jgi:hypothetical protein